MMQPCPLHPKRPSWNVGARPRTAARGYSAAHRTWRRAVLEREPYCHYRFPGCTLKSSVADHVVAMRFGGSQFDLSNGVGCCRTCHAVKSARESKGGGAAKIFSGRPK